MKKKLLSFLLIFALVFSALPEGRFFVYAAPSVTDMMLETIIQDNPSGPPTIIRRLYIYGMGFKDPQVFGGTNASRPLQVNASLSNSNVIVIDDSTSLNSIVGINNKIRVFNNNGDIEITDGANPLQFDLTSIPTITSVSNSKVYIGDPLIINGTNFDSFSAAKGDRLFVAGTPYIPGTDFSIPSGPDSSKEPIQIAGVKAANNPGLSDVAIKRYVGTANYEISTIYKNSITVVGKITNLEIERLDPNSGPKTRKNVVSIYGKPGFQNFDASMRVFVENVEGRNLGTIKDTMGNVIGLKVELPTRQNAGVVSIRLTTSDMGSELIIPDSFTYLDIGNTLTIDSGGITPDFKRETEDKVIEIKGRNIGYFNSVGYQGVTADSYRPEFNKGYNYVYKGIEYGPDAYVIAYDGFYNSTPVKIIRQIKIIIDGAAHIIEDTSNHTNDRITVSENKDTLNIKTVNVNLNPKEPKTVDASIKTITTIIDDTTGAVYYERTEEYTVKDGFRFLPNEITPSISSVTPDFGPNNKAIYMTIKGSNFEVMKDEAGVAYLPVVYIGGRAYGKEQGIKVYDDNNKEVDGKVIQVGTKIKLVMTPPDPSSPLYNLSGAVDVVVKNPSGAQQTLNNGFEFRNPNRTEDKMPKIAQVKDPRADIRGGLISGEQVKITGSNFDTSADLNHRVVVTIDGEKAALVGKVSSDGKTITIVPPPGTVPGMTMLQIINEDGSMAENMAGTLTGAEFEYVRITSAPKITKIVPSQGGKGTKLVIKGEDFILPDSTVAPDDPRRKGTVVLLNGKELNVYNYLSSGTITDIDPNTGNGTNSIYYNGPYDLDGDSAIEAGETINGEIVKVQDINTIYIDVPDKFFSFIGGSNPQPPYLKDENVPLGKLKVEVQNPDGAKSKEEVFFNFMNPMTKPKIDSVDPQSGSVNGGTVVTIKGSGFRQENIEVYFGSEKSKNVTFISSTELRAVVPIYPYELPEGSDELSVPVMVMNYDGGPGVKENGFTYRIPGSHPQITSLSPSKGSAAGNDEVIIRGKDFRRKLVLDQNNNPVYENPRVYFGGVPAEVNWYGTGLISEILVVKTPPSLVEGPVDVVIVNSDSGAYTYKSYIYEKSKPVINLITPNLISKFGNVMVQINGSGFRKNNLTKIFEGEQIERNTGGMTPTIDAIVAFGDISTGDKKYIDTVIGPFYTIMNDIRIDCDTSADLSNPLITLSRVSDGGIIKSLNVPVGSSHLFIVNGPNDLGDNTVLDEGVLVEVTANQVIVTRRIAPYAKWENDGLQLTVKAPPMGSTGERKLYVINSDKGTAEGKIMVTNPSSNPVITSITPKNKQKRANGAIADYPPEDSNALEFYTYTPLDGGAFITITGSDFRRNVKVYLDNKPLEIVSKGINDDKLVVKVPPGTEGDLDKLYRIIIVNEDGGTADSSTLPKPHYIVYKRPQSAPIIENIVPDKTSAKGQNWITIQGYDFRAGVKVFIEDIPCTEVTFVSYKEIRARIPLGLTPGKKTVQVLNNDYGFAEKKNGITIISSPQIEYVTNEKGITISPLVLSIEGGQLIRLKGTDFIEGAKVIIGGTIKAKSELKSGETGVSCYNINDVEMVVVGGTAGTNVKVDSSSSISFVTPKMKEGNTNIIVVNGDGGVSNIYYGSYQKPMPDQPSGLYVEAVDGDTVKLEWSKMDNIRYFEVYVSEGTSSGYGTADYLYLGSVIPGELDNGRLRYFVDGLKKSTWYSFKLKSVNGYGASQFSTASGYVRTKDAKIITYYQLPDAYIGGIPQENRVEVKGKTVTVIAGEKSIGNYGAGFSVNFDQAVYKAADNKKVQISLDLVKKYPHNNVSINDRSKALNMKAMNLAVEEINKVDVSNYSDSTITIAIQDNLGSRSDEIRIRVPVGYRVVVAPFKMELSLQTGKTAKTVKSLRREAQMKIKYDQNKSKIYAGGLHIAYYNSSTKTIELLKTTASGGTATANIMKSGEYMLLGRIRR